MTNKLIAFHGKQEIKDKYIARVKAHQEADEITKGIYWQNGKGCAVGCTIEGSDHKKFEVELGIPTVLAHLEDGLFESMSNEEAKKFPLRFLEAIPVGADLSDVFKHLVVWEWDDSVHGLKNIQEIKDDKELYDCCEAVTELYRRTLKGEEVETSEWSKLEELAGKIYEARAGAGAWAGAESWAWARARAGAEAWAGAESWAWAWARARAGAGAWAWAGAGAWAGAWAGARARAGAEAEHEKQVSISVEKLLELLKEAPVKI